MKPLKLTMKNIASFSGEHSVDFSLLGDMFLICGKTGSGKTTVLDAMTYALYGSLPGSRKQNDIRRLRSDFCGNSDPSFVHFEFLLNGTYYRIERNLPVSRITRNGTITEDGESAALFRKTKDGEILVSDKKSETDSLIRSLVSLSADEFSRIILLPQGDFADFLRQNSTERKTMLSKLFPVERFTRTAEALKSKKTQLADKHEEVIKNLERISPAFSEEKAEEVQKEQKKRLKQAEKQSEDLRTEIFNLKLQINEAEKNQCSYREYTEVKDKLKALTERADEYETIKQKAVVLRFALSAEPLLSAAEQAERNVRRVEAELEEKSDRLKTCIKTRAALEEEKDVQTKNEHRLKQNTLDMQKTELALNAASGMEKARTASEQSEAGLKNSLLQAEKIREELRELIKAAERQTELNGEYEKERYNLQYAEYLYLKAQEADFSQREASLQNTADNSRLMLEELTAEKEAEERLSQALSLALHLEKNKPCPVCGSTEHPSPVQKTPQKLDTEKKIQTQKELTAEAENRLQEIRNKKQELRGRINQCLAQLYEQNTAQHEGINKENEFKTENEVLPGMEEADKKRESARIRLFALAQELREEEKKASQKSFYEERLRQAEKRTGEYEKEHAADKARLKEAEKLVHSLLCDTDKPDAAPFTAAGGKDLLLSVQKTAEKLHKERFELEEKIRFYTEKSIQTEKVFAELTGTIAALEADKKIRLKEQKESIQIFNTAADKAPYDALKACGIESENYSTEKNADKEKKRKYCRTLIKELVQDRQSAERKVQDFETQTETYKSEKQKLEVLCGEKKAALSGKYGSIGTAAAPEGGLFSAEDLNQEKTTEAVFARIEAEREALLGKQKETQERLKENENLCTEIRRMLAETEAQAHEYKSLEKRRIELQKQLQVYTRLYDAVSGKNPNKLPLESWVLRMYLEEVCLCASKRLERISDGRYTLYLKKPEGGKGFQGLDLEIYDSYTGKRRPCSTLSGGETFMASISLALAVSDTVQAKNGGIQLDSLFIDEGFGSLDETALDKALAVLDEIRGSRCIGLISHVGLLKSRIPVRLEIEKGISGSRIRTIYG